MTSGGNVKGCPICAISNGTICPCKCNSLATKHPKTLEMWNYDKNDKTPYDFLPSSGKTVWWKCLNGCGSHEWEAKISNITLLNRGCPFCATANAKVCPCKCNSLYVKFPDIAKQWDDVKNEIKPDEVTYGSGKVVWWKCDKGCGNHEWQAPINKRTSSNEGCVICVNQRPCPCGCNTISSDVEMMMLYHPCNTDDPKTIIKGCSSVKYWWKCEKGCGNHMWKSDPSHIANGRRCPICVGKTICPCKCNAISTTNPEISEIWCDDNPFTMDEVTQCSDKRARFLCDEHGEWETPIKVVAKMGCGCPKCGDKIGSEKQIMSNAEFIKRCQAKYPDMFIYDRTQYAKYKDYVTITCKKHGDFQTTPRWLLGNKVTYGCPTCADINGRASNCSKVQIEWLHHMEKELNCTIQHMYNGGEYIITTGESQFKADGYCHETNTVFEFHGDFWHGNPNVYPNNMIHPVKKLTMGAIYKKTLEREQAIRNAGYNLVVIWERDWVKMQKK